MAAAWIGCGLIGHASAWADDTARPAKRDAVSVRWASHTPVAGYDALTFDRGQTVYVARKAVLTGPEVRAARTAKTGTGQDLVLTLTDPATARFGVQWEKHRGDPVAIVEGGRLLAFGPCAFNAASSAMLMSGLSTDQALRVAQLWGQAGPASGGPTITVVPSQKRVAPGSTVTVDVFVSGMSDLRVYQVTLAVEGGTTGTLERRQAMVDTSRGDYVFRNLQKLDAADQSLGRLGGVLFGKGVNATQRAYVGGYVFAASPDASGTFTLRARTDSSSILMDSNNQLKTFASEPATITVGTAGHIPGTDR
jgi:hypothetical protein